MQCAFVPAVGKTAGAAGCCKGTTCAFRVDCIDSIAMIGCNKDCQTDTETLKWYVTPPPSSHLGQNPSANTPQHRRRKVVQHRLVPRRRF